MRYSLHLVSRISLALGVLVMAPGAVQLKDEAPPESPGLAGSLDSSDVAEIYVVSRNFEFPMRLRPEMVRSSGCKYRVYRESPQWPDLEQTLAEARVELTPSSSDGDLRIGLILSDGRGMVRETYSNDMARPDGRVTGIDQRREVEISASFVAAVQRFVSQHPDLAMPEGGQVHLCPRRAG